MKQTTRKNAISRRPGYIALFCVALAVIGFLAFVVLKGTPTKNDAVSDHNPLRGTSFYIDPQSNAAKQAEVWEASNPDGAKLMEKLAQQPTAFWVTTPEHMLKLSSYVQDADEDKKLPVLVAYYLPNRDCGRYSAGGATSTQDYVSFIDQFANTIGNKKAAVILEPDAIVQIKATNDSGNPCLSDQQQADYYSLFQGAVQRFKALPNTTVYIDAGNSGWVKDYEDIASRLKQAGIDQADGFSLNISNFYTTEESIEYGEKLSQSLGGTHFVVDTSRNGLGAYKNTDFPTHSWCNPPGRALGHYPTIETGHEFVDAFLYVKYPGESDGQDPEPGKCGGGPVAGQWWPEYAEGLVARWPEKLQP